ncbi:MAG: hypothetical protein V1814_01660 [Candidatus Moraniibacteriota bacterium]
MNQKSNFLSSIFFLFFLAIIILIVFTPFLVREISVFNREQSEAVFLFVFVLLGYAVYRLHRGEIRKKNIQLNSLRSDNTDMENQLEEAFGHIGKINIQISEIRSIFSDIKKYPENKKDLNYTLDYFANKILSVVNIDWVIIKIINLSDFSTIKIHSATRGKATLSGDKISNKDIMDESYSHHEFVVIKSDQENLNLKAVCILPKKEIKQEQMAIIKAIVTRLELIYIIFSSHYYKNSRPIFIEDD